MVRETWRPIGLVVDCLQVEFSCRVGLDDWTFELVVCRATAVSATVCECT